MIKKYFGGFLWKFYTAGFLTSLVFSIAVLVPFYTEWGHLTLAQVQIPSEQRATVLSSIAMVSRITLAITGPLMGFMADYSLRGTIFFVGLLPLALFLFSPLKQEMLQEKIIEIKN